MKIIIQFGLKRSGNHGISNLILKSNNNFVHLNDLNDLDYNKFKKNECIQRILRAFQFSLVLRIGQSDIDKKEDS